MRLVVTRDCDDFAAHAGQFVAERIERNVIASVLAGLRDGATYGSTAPLFAYRLDQGDSSKVVAAAIRTPPWPLLAAGFEDMAAAVELVGGWLATTRGSWRLPANRPAHGRSRRPGRS